MKVKSVPMVTQIIIAVLLGISFGILFPHLGIEIKLIGDIFLRLMQMAIPVLILGQIIQAVAGIAPNELTKLGGKTILIFGTSSFLAAVWGVLVAFVFRPGMGVDFSAQSSTTVQAQEISASDTLLNFQNVKRNIVISTFPSVFWFKLVQIFNLSKNLRGLKHRHLADAFFLASIQDNSFEWFGY